MSTFDAKLSRLLATKTPDELKKSVVDEIGDSMEWYEVNAKRMGRYSRYLRIGAIVLGAIGAAWPMVTLTTLAFEPDGTVAAGGLGNVGYLAIALAACVLALDHHFGYSAAWMRYRLALLELERILLDFIDGWSALPEPAEGQVGVTREYYAVAKKARGALLDVLEGETSEWVKQMRLNIGGLVDGLNSRQGSNGILDMFGTRDGTRSAANGTNGHAEEVESEEDTLAGANVEPGSAQPARGVRLVNGTGATDRAVG